MTATNVLKNTLYGGGALVGADYLSNGVVSKIVGGISAKVSSILSGVKGGQLINANLPLVGALAPFALGGYALKKGLKEEKIYDKVQTTALTYGGVGFTTALLGVLSVPFSSGILATGLGIFGTKKILGAIADTYTSIKGINPIDYTVKGIKGLGTKIKNFIP